MAFGRFAHYPQPSSLLPPFVTIRQGWVRSGTGYSPAEEPLRAAMRTRLIAGTVETVPDALRTLAHETTADEIMLLTMTPDPAARRRSYELLAQAFDL